MSARDREKFYWWKKDKNYYSDHRIKSLKEEKNGYAYLTLLDQIKCESTPYNGILRFSESRAFTIEELSATVGMPIKLVKAGLEALKQKELIDILEDGTIKVLEFENCVGHETGAAKRMRANRTVKNEEQDVNDLGTLEEQSANISGTNQEQMFLESRVKSR